MKKKIFKAENENEGLKIPDKVFCFKSNGLIYKIDWCINSESGKANFHKSNQNITKYKK